MNAWLKPISEENGILHYMPDDQRNELTEAWCGKIVNSAYAVQSEGRKCSVCEKRKDKSMGVRTRFAIPAQTKEPLGRRIIAKLRHLLRLQG